jgi:N-acetylmuramoyl-L-alanine amidase
MEIVTKPCPHYTRGRSTYRPEAIVIHIMEGTLRGTDSWFANPASKVSAHYGVGKNGEVHQYVKEEDTAWHAGRVNSPVWGLIKPSGRGQYINPNYYTIGIEHEGYEDTEWSEAMYVSSSRLVAEISKRWNIPLDRQHVIGHHEIYALKTCPGRRVDLHRLILLASGQPEAASTDGAKVRIPGKAVTRLRLNIRQTPGTRYPPLATVNANTELAYEGYTDEGENVGGNSTWYFTKEGTWFWSGGV